MLVMFSNLFLFTINIFYISSYKISCFSIDFFFFFVIGIKYIHYAMFFIIAGVKLSIIFIISPIDKIGNLAKKYKLSITGGSDFHGSITVGEQSIGSYGINDILLEKLINLKR